MGLSITYYLDRFWYTLVLYWTKESTRFTFKLLEILGIKVTHRQIDRQTDKFFETKYVGVHIFSFSSICYCPTRFACRGITFKKLEHIAYFTHFSYCASPFCSTKIMFLLTICIKSYTSTHPFAP